MVRHETPEEFDYLFDRDLITAQDYKWFWTNYWSLKEDDMPSDFIDDLIDQAENLHEQPTAESDDKFFWFLDPQAWKDRIGKSRTQ